MVGLTGFDGVMLLVVWADAHGDGDGWTSLEEIDDDGEYLVRSVGFLLSVEHGGKDGHVTLAQSLTPDDMVDHLIHIPVGMVRQRVVLASSPESLIP